MAESELGTAVLALRVDTDSALQALGAFRRQVESQLQNSGTVKFDGLEQNARASGQKAGRAIADAIKQATSSLRFDNISEALDFSDALNGTLRDLRQYRDALVALREVTDATAPGFYALNDAIEATSQAIKNYSASTDQLQDAAAKTAARELTAELRKQRDAVLDNARVDRQWSDAIRTIESAQKNAAAATREANQAFRDQLSAVGSLASKGAKDIGGTVGAIGRGVGAAARGAVRAGRAGYNLGAEFGVFEEPRTGPVKKAIQEVIDRFKFLGEQAETTRGILLRSFEGAGAAAGLAAIAQNADQLKAALNGLSSAAAKTDAAVGGIAKFGQYLADVFNNGGWLTDNGNTIIGQLLNISAATEKAGAAAVSLGDRLVQLGAGAAGGALNGLEAITGAIGSIPPEAQAAVLALAGLSLGFKEKPIVDGLTTVLEYLDNLKGKALSVRGDLQSVLTGLENFQQKLNAGNDQKLLPAFTERGLQVLDDTVRQGESFRRVTDAIGDSWQRGTRFLEKSNEEMRRLIEQGLELKQLGTGPSGLVPQETNQLPPGAPSSFRPDPNAYATPGATAPQLPRQLFEDDLAAVQARRLAIEQDIAEAKEETLRLAEIENKRGREIGRLNAVSRDGRLPDGSFAPGSPGARAARRRRLTEAGSNALIGGAFPALFGQGLGASVGGALGGGAGGLVGGQFGFGLSLLGTALGAQFDEATRKLQAVGDALSDPIGQLNALTEAGLLSSKGLEKQVQALIDTGREAEAAALIQKDLSNSFGELQNAKELAVASDELNRSWARLQVSLGALVGSPIVDLLSETTSALQKFASTIQFLRNAIPEPIRKQAAAFGTDFALSALLPGLKSVRDIAKFLPGSGGGSSGNPQQQQAEIATNERVTELRQLRLRLISSEVQGNKELSLQLERQRTELEKQAALENSRARNESPLKQQEIAAKFNEELLRIDERRLALEKERTAEVRRRVDIERAAANELSQIRDQLAVASRQAANENAAAREDLAIQQRRAGGLGSSGASALASVNSIEAAKRDVELAKVRQDAAQSAAIRAEREALILRDRIDVLRKEGASQNELNTAQQAALAARNAAEQARNEYELGGKALETAGVAVKTSAFQAKADLSDLLEGIQDTIRSLSRNIEDSVGSLRRLQNNRGEGLNRFLSAQQVSDRQAAVGRQLAPEAQRLAEQLGVRFSVSGTREQINAQLLDFIEAARNELRISEDIGQAQRDLAKATNDLTTINDALKTVTGELATLTGQLAENTAALASKDWNIYVNASASGDLPRGVEVYQQ